MLDTLLLRLFPLWWIGSLWQHSQGDRAPDVMGGMLVVVLVLFALGWALGAVANGRPRPPEEAPQRIQDTHSNGFEAWSEPPAGGLAPPAWLRAVVMTLGRRSVGNGWTALVGLVLFFAACALLWILAYRSEASWIGIHPALANRSVRDALEIGAAMVVTLFVLRQWAVQQRQRLEPVEVTPASPGSEWMGFGLLSVLVVGLVLIPTLTFGWPAWIIALPVPALAVFAVVPEWRKALLDAVFGKRVEPEAARSSAPGA